MQINRLGETGNPHQYRGMALQFPDRVNPKSRPGNPHLARNPRIDNGNGSGSPIKMLQRMAMGCVSRY